MRPRVRGIDLIVRALGHPRLADERLGEPVGVMHIVEAEAALDAEPRMVCRARPALGIKQLVVLDLEGDLAAHPAIGADAVDLAVRFLGEALARVEHGRGHERARGAGLHAFAAGNAGALAHRVVEVEDDLRMMAAPRHADHVVDLDLAAGADAEIAVDAGVEIDAHRGMAVVLGGRGANRETRELDRECIGPAPELGLGVVRGRTRRLVGHEQLHHHLARRLGALGAGRDHHPRCGLADAGGGEHALALDFHHAGAAIAVGAVVRIGLPAEVRDFVAEAIGHLPDGLAGSGLDLAPIHRELDRLAHAKSSRKYLNTLSSGLGAAWPRPQIEASRIAAESSSSSFSSHRGRSISLTAFSVPTRQGVHWPQLSSSKKRMRFKATLFMSSLSERTTMAAEPMKQPCGSSVPKSSGMS